MQQNCVISSTLMAHNLIQISRLNTLILTMFTITQHPMAVLCRLRQKYVPYNVFFMLFSVYIYALLARAHIFVAYLGNKPFL